VTRLSTQNIEAATVAEHNDLLACLDDMPTLDHGSVENFVEGSFLVHIEHRSTNDATVG